MLVRTLIAAIVLVFGATSGYAQAVHQTGTVTRGHIPSWANPGLLQDGGGALNGHLQSLGIVPAPLTPDPPFCINDTLISSLTGYHQLCFSGDDAFGDGGGLTYAAIGGAANDPLTLQSANILALNSNIQQIDLQNLPATVAGDVRVCVNPATGQMFQASATTTTVNLFLTDDTGTHFLTDDTGANFLTVNYTIPAGQCAPS